MRQTFTHISIIECTMKQLVFINVICLERAVAKSTEFDGHDIKLLLIAL